MAGLAPLLVLSAFILGATQQTLNTRHASFCRGGLKVIYPELNVDKCLIIPKERELREKISRVWRAPMIYFRGAQQKKYVLMMVDPDAPSHRHPTSAYWRHWLVVDIQGKALQKGKPQGTTLTEYYPPGPPLKTGFHRYQFMLFEQPADAQVSLTKQEMASRAKWDFQAFVKRFNLGKPVAAMQFLTQNYED